MARTSTILLSAKEHPFSTTVIITHSATVESSSKTSNSFLSREVLKVIKEKNLIMAFKMILSSRGISIEKSQSSSTASWNDPSGNSSDLMVQQLKGKVFDMDLFQTIEDNIVILSDINTFWNSLTNQIHTTTKNTYDNSYERHIMTIVCTLLGGVWL